MYNWVECPLGMTLTRELMPDPPLDPPEPEQECASGEDCTPENLCGGCMDVLLDQALEDGEF